MDITNKEEFNKYILECYPQEACGVIVNDMFIPHTNVHSDPVNCFELAKDVCFDLITNNIDYKVIHSHTMDKFQGDPRTPSLDDMLGKANTAVPWGIVHCDGEQVSDILWFGDINDTPLLNRSYISNVHDCFTLARDFIYLNFNVDVGVHPRPANWEEWNPHYIEDNFVSSGFKIVEINEKLRFGDVLLYRIGSQYINHIGIYLQDNTFIHHLHNRKSCEDSVSKWNRQFAKAIRLEDKCYA